MLADRVIGELRINRIEGVTTQQDIEFQLLKMDIPKIREDPVTRNLQQKLNESHRKVMLSEKEQQKENEIQELFASSKKNLKLTNLDRSKRRISPRGSSKTL